MQFLGLTLVRLRISKDFLPREKTYSHSGIFLVVLFALLTLLTIRFSGVPA